MIKNVRKNVHEGGAILRRNERLDLTVTNVMEIEDFYNVPRSDELITLIMDCYKMGVAVGVREGKRQRAKI